jgi:hypothetical protein
MRLLELFCGTKSVSKAVGNRFSEIISLDIDRKADPTIVADILTWDYTVYPPEYFHSIWASPPCNEYSLIRDSKPGCPPNLALADSIVNRTIEIINYFNPIRWYIENPQSGKMKDRPMMEGIPYVDCDYCRFSDWGYRKRTRFWGNVISENVLCDGEGRCPNMTGASHRTRIFPLLGQTIRRLTMEEKHRIPPTLIQHLFDLPTL